jgi:hypothetical protein
MNKAYLGDAVYVSHDGSTLTLTTENGVAVTNSIAYVASESKAAEARIAESKA